MPKLQPNHYANLGKIDALLQGGDAEGLHNLLGWRSLHLDGLAEGDPGASLPGRLHPGLDHAEAWDGELACLLHLSCGKAGKAVKERRALRLLQATGACQGISDATLGKGLGRDGLLLHGLHNLHGNHFRNGWKSSAIRSSTRVSFKP